MSVWICQCLCELRHCLMATAINDTEYPKKYAEMALRKLITTRIETGEMIPYCTTCKSRVFHYETGLTVCKSAEEAVTILRRLNLVRRQSSSNGDLIEQVNAMAARS